MTYDPKSEADMTYDRYDAMRPVPDENAVPDNELLQADTITTQSLSELPEDAVRENEDPEQLQDVPDADEIAANSPVDPAAPPTDVMHGTDLLNGYAAGDTDEEME